MNNNFNGKKYDLKDFFKKRKTTVNIEHKANPMAVIKALLGTLVFLFVVFFFALPSLSPFTFGLYFMIIIGEIFFYLLFYKYNRGNNSKIGKVLTIIVVLAIVIPGLGRLFSQEIFRAKSYAKMINVQEGSFAKDITRVKIENVPTVDRDSAKTIGQRQMGSMTDFVSQFEIDDNYTQINIKGKPYRVSPLSYSDIIKYFNNNSKGIPGYVSVNMTTQDAELVNLKNPIMYSNSDILFRDLKRKLRFQYPFAIFGETNFEVNDNNEAFYVTGVQKKTIGFFSGEDTVGAILTNAYTGESTYYDVKDVPSWVDRVYPSDMIIKQLDNYGKYSNGFLNSKFGQKNVTQTSEGYNYISMDDDVYLYTGITSVRSDKSNIGFYYVNLRTKDTKFYRVSSVSEMSAMDAAKGQVQEKGYKPTFPILLNIADRPVYFLSLKDNSDLAKMYALVDAENYQNVYVGYSVADTLRNYATSTDKSTVASEKSVEKTIKVEKVTSAVMDGNTVFFIKAQGDNIIYIGNAKKLGSSIVFIKEGDSLKVFGNQTEKQFDIIEIR